MKRVLLFTSLVLIGISCGSDSDGDDPMLPEIKPSIESFMPLMGIEGDTITIQLKDYNSETVSEVSFGAEKVTWFEVNNNNVKTIVPDEIIRGEAVQINVNIEGETTTSAEFFQVPNLTFTDVNRTLFLLGDTITISGANLNLDKSSYEVRMVNEAQTFLSFRVIDVTSTELRIVRDDYPGEVFFYAPFKFQIGFDGERILLDKEVTLTRSYTISNRHNSISHAPGSLLHVNIIPGNGVFDQLIMLGNEELTSVFSFALSEGRQYSFIVPTSTSVGETLKVIVSEGENEFLLSTGGRDTIRMEDATFDFSPKEVISDLTTQITIEVSHVYSPPDYKVFIINESTNEEIELVSLREDVVEENRMVLTGTAAINERGTYLVKFSIRDDEYLLTPTNGAELVFREN